MNPIITLNTLNNCEVKEARWDPVNYKTEVYVSGKQFHLLEKLYEQFVYCSRHQIQREVEELSFEVNNIIPENIINNITLEDIKTLLMNTRDIMKVAMFQKMMIKKKNRTFSYQ